MNQVHESSTDPNAKTTTLQIYRHKSPDGEVLWVFDDPEVQLDKEPLIEGMPEIIAGVLRKQGLPPSEPFTLTFSTKPFRNSRARQYYSLSWLYEGDGDGGN